MSVTNRMITKDFYKKYTILIVVFIISCYSIKAQFDSTIWSSYYSNHSVSSRDTVFDARLFNGKSLIITGNTENDFTNFDITTFNLDNNLNLVWKESYSSKENDLSFDYPSSMTVDSSGNVFIAGYSKHYPYENAPVFYKHDSTGKILWTRNFNNFDGGQFVIYSFDIESDALGNCYLLANGSQPESTSNSRTFIMKFDRNGTLVWYKKTGQYEAEKVIVDNNQDILVINNRDENQNLNTIIKKYTKDGDLAFEKRYYNYVTELVDAKIDRENCLWTFSNFSYSGLSVKKTCDILISRYDSDGNLMGQKIYDSQYHDYESIRQVASYNDSTFLIGMDSKSPDNGLDNLLILINKNLQVVDSFRYDSEFNDNDYLISLAMSDNKSIIVTGISFVDYVNFFPFVYKIDDFKSIKWRNVPSISDRITTYPKKVLADNNGSIFLVGDVQMTISPESGYDTHSNIFVTRLDSSGNEILTKEFGEAGKSNIIATNVKLDKNDNIYVSGHDQYGPDFVYPFHYYNQGLILHKYSGEGVLKWNKKIFSTKTLLEYVNHFITNDSLITVVGGYPGQPNGYTVLYNFNNNGIAGDSAAYDRKVISSVTDNKGTFFLFFIVDQSFLILKYNSRLEIEKSINLPRGDCFDIITSMQNGYIYLLSRDKNYLCKLDSDLNLKWQIYLSTYFENTVSLLTDKSDNIYISGYKNSGRLIKIQPTGEILWSLAFDKLISPAEGIDKLSSGELVLYGQEATVNGITQFVVALVSENGVLKKYVTTRNWIYKHGVDKRDFIYIFSNLNWSGSQNSYQKYSPNLDLLITDYFNKDNTFGYTFDFYDIGFDSLNNIIMAGSVGYYMGYMNGMFSWYTLALTKVGKVNTHPVFIDKNIKKKILPGDTLILRSPAIDYDNDSITYNLVTSYKWIESQEIPGTFLLSPTIADTGYYKISISASDKYGGTDTNKISLLVGNKPPHFTSTPIDSVTLNTDYKYALTATDPDDEIIHFKISVGPGWLTLDSTGVLSGKPIHQQDTGFYQIRVTCFDNYKGEDNQIFTLHVDAEKTIGIDDINQNVAGILVYPIPASSIVYLESGLSVSKNINIKIVNLNGTLVRDFPIKEIKCFDKIHLDINGLKPGIYLLVINKDKRNFTKRIIIE